MVGNEPFPPKRWRVVIAAYENLWQELAQLRVQATTTAPLNSGMPPYPLCDDPCRLLTHYPTQVLSQEQVLGLGSLATPEGLKTLSDVWITNFGADKRSPTATIEQVIAAIAQEGPLTVKEILDRYAGLEPGARVYLCRTLVYLVKFDILRSLFDSMP